MALTRIVTLFRFVYMLALELVEGAILAKPRLTSNELRKMFEGADHDYVAVDLDVNSVSGRNENPNPTAFSLTYRPVVDDSNGGVVNKVLGGIGTRGFGAIPGDSNSVNVGCSSSSADVVSTSTVIEDFPHLPEQTRFQPNFYRIVYQGLMSLRRHYFETPAAPVPPVMLAAIRKSTGYDYMNFPDLVEHMVRFATPDHFPPERKKPWPGREKLAKDAERKKEETEALLNDWVDLRRWEAIQQKNTISGKTSGRSSETQNKDRSRSPIARLSSPSNEKDYEKIRIKKKRITMRQEQLYVEYYQKRYYVEEMNKALREDGEQMLEFFALTIRALQNVFLLRRMRVPDIEFADDWIRDAFFGTRRKAEDEERWLHGFEGTVFRSISLSMEQLELEYGSRENVYWPAFTSTTPYFGSVRPGKNVLFMIECTGVFKLRDFLEQDSHGAAAVDSESKDSEREWMDKTHASKKEKNVQDGEARPKKKRRTQDGEARKEKERKIREMANKFVPAAIAYQYGKGVRGVESSRAGNVVSTEVIIPAYTEFRVLNIDRDKAKISEKIRRMQTTTGNGLRTGCDSSSEDENEKKYYETQSTYDAIVYMETTDYPSALELIEQRRIADLHRYVKHVGRAQSSRCQGSGGSVSSRGQYSHSMPSAVFSWLGSAAETEIANANTLENKKSEGSADDSNSTSQGRAVLKEMYEAYLELSGQEQPGMSEASAELLTQKMKSLEDIAETIHPDLLNVWQGSQGLRKARARKLKYAIRTLQSLCESDAMQVRAHRNFYARDLAANARRSVALEGLGLNPAPFGTWGSPVSDVYREQTEKGEKVIKSLAEYGEKLEKGDDPGEAASNFMESLIERFWGATAMSVCIRHDFYSILAEDPLGSFRNAKKRSLRPGPEVFRRGFLRSQEEKTNNVIELLVKQGGFLWRIPGSSPSYDWLREDYDWYHEYELVETLRAAVSSKDEVGMNRKSTEYSGWTLGRRTRIKRGDTHMWWQKLVRGEAAWGAEYEDAFFHEQSREQLIKLEGRWYIVRKNVLHLKQKELEKEELPL